MPAIDLAWPVPKQKGHSTATRKAQARQLAPSVALADCMEAESVHQHERMHVSNAAEAASGQPSWPWTVRRKDCMERACWPYHSCQPAAHLALASVRKLESWLSLIWRLRASACSARAALRSKEM